MDTDSVRSVRDISDISAADLGRALVSETRKEKHSEAFLAASIVRMYQFDASLRMRALVPAVVGHVKALDAYVYHSIAALVAMNGKAPFQAFREMIVCAATAPWNPAFYAVKEGGSFYPFGIAGPGSTMVSASAMHADAVTTIGMYMICDQTQHRVADPYSYCTSIQTTLDSATANHGAEVFEPFRLPLLYHLIVKSVDLSPGNLQMQILSVVVACLPRDLPFYGRMEALLNDLADALAGQKEADSAKVTESLLAEALQKTE